MSADNEDSDTERVEEPESGLTSGALLDPVLAFGNYLRSQRRLAELSLRQMAELTNLSNPYLSKLERGLHQPSVSAVATIAKALGVPAETLFARAAGITPERDGDGGPSADTEAAIRSDARLSDDQKLALLGVYRSFIDIES